MDPFLRTNGLIARGRGALVGKTLALLLFTGFWGLWFVLADVGVVATSTDARLELAQRAYAIVSPSSGRVVFAQLELGREVKAGDVLVELETDLLDQALAEQRSKLPPLEHQREGVASERRVLEEALALRKDAGIAGRNADDARGKEAEIRAHLASEERARTEALWRSGAGSEQAALQARAAEQEALAALQRVRHERTQAGLDDGSQARDRQASIEVLRQKESEIDRELATVKGAIERLTLELARRTLRAPIDGRLASVTPLRLGQKLEEGVSLAEVLPKATVRVVAYYKPSEAFGRIRAGQAAALRLEGFPWTQFGAARARVEVVADEVSDGKVRVELAIVDAPPSLPLSHGLPTQVEVEVERLAPWALVLRAAGRALSDPGALAAQVAAEAGR